MTAKRKPTSNLLPPVLWNVGWGMDTWRSWPATFRHVLDQAEAYAKGTGKGFSSPLALRDVTLEEKYVLCLIVSEQVCIDSVKYRRDGVHVLKELESRFTAIKQSPRYRTSSAAMPKVSISDGEAIAKFYQEVDADMRAWIRHKKIEHLARVREAVGARKNAIAGFLNLAIRARDTMYDFLRETKPESADRYKLADALYPRYTPDSSKAPLPAAIRETRTTGEFVILAPKLEALEKGLKEYVEVFLKHPTGNGMPLEPTALNEAMNDLLPYAAAGYNISPTSTSIDQPDNSLAPPTAEPLVDFPNPSAPISKKDAADAWGGDMTVKKLTELMTSGKVRFRQLSRQMFIFCRDDVPNLPDR